MSILFTASELIQELGEISLILSMF